MRLYITFFRTIFFISIILVTLSCSEDDDSSVTQSNSSSITSPTVENVIPADSSTDVAVDVSISISFSKTMEPDTITTNSDNMSCFETIQLSSDDFISCVQMTSDVSSDSSDLIFTVSPATDLAYSTQYKIKISTGVEDLYGNALASSYVTIDGFTTVSEPDTTILDTTAPTLIEISPSDNITYISRFTDITTKFSERMDTSSITTNTVDTNCTGSIQLSNDGFVSCIQMDTHPTTTVAGDTFTVTPTIDLDYTTTYTVKITTDATDLSGNSLSSDYIQPTGFTTLSPIVIFRTDSTSNGAFTAATHQSSCESAQTSQGISRPNVKPFISNSEGYIEDILGIPRTGVKVTSSNGTQLKSDWDSIWTDWQLDVSLFAAGVFSSNEYWWSGSSKWGGSSLDCTDWTVSDTTLGEQGFAGVTDDTWIAHSSLQCSNTLYLLCVAW
jgi:Bacterial Ig-like domain